MNKTLTVPVPVAPLSGAAARPDGFRVQSVDVLRGLVMMLMALDHVRGFLHLTASTDDPLNLDTTTPLLFATRWITHYCAPVFVFLSGVSVYLQGLRKTKPHLCGFLLKRGAWLVLAEITLITFGLTFNPFFNVLILQVIWSIGISMMLLALLIRLPFGYILGLGLAIVLGHNLLDGMEAAPGFDGGFWWHLLHRPAVHPLSGTHSLDIFYPFLPWTGLMLLGYCAGVFFGPGYGAARRRTTLAAIGGGLLLCFVGLRLLNGYGDPHPWSVQKSPLFTVLSFVKAHKYPPSLLYMCLTIGPVLLFLAAIERVCNRFTDAVQVFGRTAFFYYILHFYLIHALCALSFFARGHSIQEATAHARANPLALLFVMPGEGYALPVVYGVWLALVAGLYPICKRYDAFKTARRDLKWLAYL